MLTNKNFETELEMFFLFQSLHWAASAMWWTL